MHTDPDSKTPEPTWKDPPIKVESEKEEESHPMEDEDKTKELENKFEDMISNLPKQLSSEHPTHENNHKISAYLCFSSDEEKLDPEYLNDSSEKVIWLPTQKALKEELEWLSMQGMNVKSSRSSLLAAGAIFQ
ncbi:Histone deacetylase 10, partial [Caligus rogercresseyi]